MIRNVSLRDAKAIVDIYNEYIVNSVITFETEPLREEEMRERMAAISASYPYLVYLVDDEVAGYCYAHAWKERAAYRYTLETTVYLSPGYKGKGIGRLLMERLIEECRAGGFHALIACITEGNEASYSLHEKLGFRKVSHFEKVGMKFGRWLDVVDYELIL
ncbi:GNAT family N-acetyltransferase [Parabacteroides distasonis]|uniref:GNAT family N-acetyltransferase n=1 Tax=Parabacteroides distasonis TaxID=823 RepID=A0A1Y4IA36_PARDI|nr:GNAT family N-acetyltransferase [Parabacteroides distasonis]OUP15880.1 GNAT family N-acetyltransferase [Parabacteroides distasonis]